MDSVNHGGDLKRFAKTFGVREEDLLDFSCNINPLGIPDSVARVYRESERELSLYPDPRAEDLCKEVSGHYGLLPENVIAGNGSMGLLALTLRTLNPKKALLVEPCFTEYRRLLALQGVEISSVLLKASQEFQFPLAEILDAMKSVECLILGHPNNPTGTVLKRAELLALLEEAGRRGVFVVLDEAFADWMPEISASDQVRRMNHLIVIRSLTKFFALPGIRAGFALGPASWIEKMQHHQETWSCNRLAQKLSVAALRDAFFQERSRAWFRGESEWFRKALSSLEGFRVFPSAANFFLAKAPLPPKSVSLFEFLGSRGICPRSVADFKGLDESYFRTAVLLREDNRVLLESLKLWIQESVKPVAAS